MPFTPFDREKLKILPLSERKNTFTLDRIFKLDDPVPEFKHPLLDDAVDRVAKAFINEKQIIWMQGSSKLLRWHMLRRRCLL